MVKLFRVLCTSLVLLCAAGIYSASVTGDSPTEAPTGFDTLTNGVVDQATHDDDRVEFEEIQDIASGLGPVYNAQGCGECHQTPVTGGISQVTELRVGRFFAGVFTPHPGGSVINDRAIDASIQEHVFPADNVRTFRTALNVLGDGFVEALADDTIRGIANRQPPSMRGEVIEVEVVEVPGFMRVGRFGWKNQHASLLSFSGDAYLNEQGITNRLFLTENTSDGRSVADFDPVPDTPPDGEDADHNIDMFAQFMRATKAPPRDLVLAATFDAQVGSHLFNAIGCNVCHVRNIVTAPEGTLINGGTFIVPPELGNKRIHPFGDFLLHDIGTGDGIVQNGGPSTRNKMRTAPLWGVRTRSRLMHDGLSLTFEHAIERHEHEARVVEERFDRLSRHEKNQLLTFLRSL